MSTSQLLSPLDTDEQTLSAEHKVTVDGYNVFTRDASTGRITALESTREEGYPRIFLGQTVQLKGHPQVNWVVGEFREPETVTEVVPNIVWVSMKDPATGEFIGGGTWARPSELVIDGTIPPTEAAPEGDPSEDATLVAAITDSTSDGVEGQIG